ncbi:MAG: metallophosphoesterase [Candidatus Lokiarchaeota archaeon]|nr:metallophosphoesterase [Candidatus Lokiarchaeota archaeon]
MKISTKLFPHYARYIKRIDEIPTTGTPRRIVIISDTHITDGSDFNKLVFKKGIDEITKIKKVDYVIHLGDLTQSGTFLDYEMALDCIEPILNEKFFIIPGNHDARNVGYLLFEEFFESRTFEIEDKKIYVLGIDSSIPDLDSGKIGMRNIEKSRQLISGVDQDKIKILCFHHQLLPIPLTGRERSAIIDGGDGLKMILDTNIDLVINGHRHISNVYSCTDGDGELIIFNSGNFSSSKTRYRELFTYSIIDIFEKAITITTKKIMDGEKIKRGRYFNRIFNPNPPIHKKDLKLKIVHIANTHFSKNTFDENIYNKAIQQINALKADIVIHSGDVTNSNNIEEFELANKLLNKIIQPKIIIPGDTDLINIGWELFPKIIGPLDTYFENETFRVIGINSIDKSLKSGSVGRRTVRDTVKLFTRFPKNKINIVTLYHNLIPHPKTRFETILTDSGNVLKTFTEPENKIDFILSGHDHISFTFQVEDTILSTCGTLSSNEYLDLNGNTYNIINCYDDGFVEIERIIVESNESDIIGTYWININQ